MQSTIQSWSPFKEPLYKKLFEILAVLSITMIAVALRFYKLGEWSYGPDEAFTILGWLDGMNNGWLHESLSHILIRLTVDVFSTTEWTARLIPALIGSITIPVLYSLLRRMVYPSIAYFTAFLLAISPWHLSFSQNARYYVALVLFYLLALCLFYLALENDKPIFMLGSIIFMGLAVKERPYALLIVPVIVSYLVALYALKYEKPPGLTKRNLLLLFVPSIVAGSVFIIPYIIHREVWFTGFGLANTTYSGSFMSSLYWIRPIKLAMAFITQLGAPVAGLSFTGILCVCFMQRTQNTRYSRSGLLIALGTVVPLALLMLLALFFLRINVRYTFIILPCCLALSSIAFFELVKSVSRHRLAFSAGIIGMLLASSSLAIAFYINQEHGARPNYRAALEFVEAQMREDDILIVTRPSITQLYGFEEFISGSNLDPSIISSSDQRHWFVGDFTASPNTTQYQITQVTSELSDWIDKNTVALYYPEKDSRLLTKETRVYLYAP